MEPFAASLTGMNGRAIVPVGSLVNLVTNKVGAAAVDILFIACVFSVNTVCKGILSFWLAHFCFLLVLEGKRSF